MENKNKMKTLGTEIYENTDSVMLQFINEGVERREDNVTNM
jgi:hypothetical protein